MNIPLRIIFKSDNWENFFYMIFFLGLAFTIYHVMNWNVKIRREKGWDEIGTRTSIIKKWIYIVCFIFCALICLLRLLF
jgi:hypothetical protein